MKIEDAGPRLRERIHQALQDKSTNYADQNRSPLSSPKPEQAVCNGSDGQIPGETKHVQRVRIVIESFRRKLLDPDNLCPKYFLDGIKYAGLIPDDSPDKIELIVRQTKVDSHEDERTEIEIG